MTFHSFDGEYLERLKNGDPAVEQHFAAYFGELLHIKLRSRLRYGQLIEDIKQETLLRVLQILRRKGGVAYPERFGAFVNSVCNNVMLEACRAGRRTEPLDEDHHEPVDTVDLDAPLISSDRKRQVEAALAELPEKDREILREVYLEERDKTEVCRRFGVDANYLRVLIHRAKERFRKVFRQAVM